MSSFEQSDAMAAGTEVEPIGFDRRAIDRRAIDRAGPAL
jgi:hypothetical protein